MRLHDSVESRVLVDAIVDRIRDTATEQQALGLLAGLGCDAAEVFVRFAGGSGDGVARLDETATGRGASMYRGACRP